MCTKGKVSVRLANEYKTRWQISPKIFFESTQKDGRGNFPTNSQSKFLLQLIEFMIEPLLIKLYANKKVYSMLLGVFLIVFTIQNLVQTCPFNIRG